METSENIKYTAQMLHVLLPPIECAGCCALLARDPLQGGAVCAPLRLSYRLGEPLYPGDAARQGAGAVQHGLHAHVSIPTRRPYPFNPPDYWSSFLCPTIVILGLVAVGHRVCGGH